MELNDGVVSPDDFTLLLFRPELQHQASAFQVTVPPEYGMTLELVPGDRLLGYNLHGNGYSCPLCRADCSQRIVYIPIPQGSTCAEIADATEARATRYLFVAPERAGEWAPGLLSTCANEQDVLRDASKACMPTSAARRLEAWLVLAAMLVAMAWYAGPKLVYAWQMVRSLASLLLANGGG